MRITMKEGHDMFLVHPNGSCVKISAVRCVKLAENLHDIELYTKTSKVRFSYKDEDSRNEALSAIHHRLSHCNDSFTRIGNHMFVTESIESIDFGFSMCTIYTDAGQFTHKWREWENRENVKEKIAESLGLYIKV